VSTPGLATTWGTKANGPVWLQMNTKLFDDCFLHDKARLRHVEALAILRERVRPVVGTKTIDLRMAAGRIVANSVIAPQAVPAHTNAAVDGYSFAADDYDQTAGGEFTIAGRAAAGHALELVPAAGTAARIFTGAIVPHGHDTVVMQEDVQIKSAGSRTIVVVPPGLKRSANVRKSGEDVKAGETLFAAGAILRPQDLAALASIGLGEVRCFEQLRVAIISTGDEVVRVGATLKSGHVFDANAPMLEALIAAAGAVTTDLGVFRDDLALTKNRLAEAAGKFDAIITTGGASRGEEDHVVAALDGLGKRHIWQLAIKPGRPMTFGQIGDCVVLGLPGNPVAVFVCFLLYVWPLLRSMGGGDWPEPRRYRLPALFAFPNRKIGRREFWRGMLKETPRGLGVDKFARDGSGLISGLRMADGLIDIPEDIAEVKPGDLVSFIPFSEYAISGR
jgi:molybdopterin molybdotransferase